MAHYGGIPDAPTGRPPSRDKLRSYKTVLLGEASVGKSSLVTRFVKNSFEDAMETTIGAAFFTRTVEVDGKTVKFEIWDTAGQERFSSLAPMYYRGASAAIVVYDQSNEQSFERAQTWVQQLQLSGNPNIVIALAANKADLPNKAVDLQVAKRYADVNGVLFIETSAKTGQNIVQIFRMLASRFPEVPFSAHGSMGGMQTVRITADPTTSGTAANTSSSSTRGCCGGGGG